MISKAIGKFEVDFHCRGVFERFRDLHLLDQRTNLPKIR